MLSMANNAGIAMPASTFGTSSNIDDCFADFVSNLDKNTRQINKFTKQIMELIYIVFTSVQHYNDKR